MNRSFAKGFTLIELLIVVAIIAILAAIAVPNFLEAQTRSKVSRALSDLRATAIAIEAYTVDNNKPVREYCTCFPYFDPNINGSPASGIIFPGNETVHGLSTPIAYITTAWLIDPFVQQGENIPEDEQRFSYKAIRYRSPLGSPNSVGGIFGGSGTAAEVQNAHLDWFGEWNLLSIGPDRDYFNRETRTGGRTTEVGENIIYDPTNGTVSLGNIFFSQKQGGNQNQPPTNPALLGAH